MCHHIHMLPCFSSTTLESRKGAIQSFHFIDTRTTFFKVISCSLQENMGRHSLTIRDREGNPRAFQIPLERSFMLSIPQMIQYQTLLQSLQPRCSSKDCEGNMVQNPNAKSFKAIFLPILNFQQETLIHNPIIKHVKEAS